MKRWMFCLILLAAVGSLHGSDVSRRVLSRPVYKTFEPLADSSLAHDLDSLRRKYKLVGLSIAAVRGDSLSLAYSAGMRDLKRALPVENSTKFRVASISKLIGATALLQLSAQGLVDLKADISNDLGMRVRNPHFPDVPITFAQILTHTSSLRDCANSVKFIKATYLTPSRPPSLREVLIPGGAYYSKELWSDSTAPGDSLGWSYCNFAAVLTATVVEKISGQRYEDYCQDHIFCPLGMKASFFPQELEDVNQLAVLYEMDSLGHTTPTKDDFSSRPQPNIKWRTAPIGVNAALYAPQAGLRCSALDLAKFMFTFMHHGRYGITSILQPETVDCMLTLQWAGQGKFYNMEGMQFQITDDLIPGQRLYGHIGFDYGFRGDMFFSPDQQFGMVFFTNGGNYPSEAYRIIEPETDFFGLVMRRLSTSASK